MPAEPASEGLEEEENGTIRIGCILVPLFMCFVPGLSGMPCPEKNLKGLVLRWFTVHSGNGPGLVCFRVSGDAVWPNMMPLQGLPGIGKRHVLAGGNGVPLSLAVSGADRHDRVPLQENKSGAAQQSQAGVAHVCANLHVNISLAYPHPAPAEAGARLPHPAALSCR